MTADKAAPTGAPAAPREAAPVGRAADKHEDEYARELARALVAARIRVVRGA